MDIWIDCRFKNLKAPFINDVMEQWEKKSKKKTSVNNIAFWQNHFRWFMLLLVDCNYPWEIYVFLLLLVFFLTCGRRVIWRLWRHLTCLFTWMENLLLEKANHIQSTMAWAIKWLLTDSIMSKQVNVCINKNTKCSN